MQSGVPAMIITPFGQTEVPSPISPDLTKIGFISTKHTCVCCDCLDRNENIASIDTSMKIILFTYGRSFLYL